MKKNLIIIGLGIVLAVLVGVFVFAYFTIRYVPGSFDVSKYEISEQTEDSSSANTDASYSFDDFSIGGGSDSSLEKQSGESSDDYVLADSDSEYLTNEDLEGLSAEELSYARNEIYARHGRIFDSEDLQAYFEGKDWYEGLYTEDGFPSDALNDYEEANAKLIKEYEAGLVENE